MVFVYGCTTSAYAQEPVSLSENNASVNPSDNQISYLGFTRFAALSSENSEKITLTVENIKETTASLVWNSDSVGVSYDICKYNPVSKDYEYYATTSKNNYKLEKLSAGTTYSFALKNSSTSQCLGEVSFTTEIKKPELKVEDVSSTSVELKVSNVSKNATVEIYRGTDASNMKKIGTISNKKTYIDKKVKSKKNYVYKAVAKASNKKTNSKKVNVKTATQMGLPKVSGKTKTYAYYTAVTVKSSPQYKLLNSKKCYTDSKTGIRMVDDCYCIALGSYYGSKIGTKYKITLSSGKTFKAILCDQKANRHTDSKNQYAMRNKDIVEFYVQKGKIPKGVRGDYGKLEQFKGKVVKIEKY